jgi:hypothetical protein
MAKAAKNEGDAKSKVLDPAVVALHRHWLRADAIRVRMRLDAPIPEEHVLTELEVLGQQFSKMQVLEVFYALLYVVVEGYRAVGIKDETIEKLLDEADYEDQLRRFRNTVFHYQNDVIDKRLVEFMDAKDSEKWTRKLYAAFERFFVDTLPIKETLEVSKGDVKGLAEALSQVE